MPKPSSKKTRTTKKQPAKKSVLGAVARPFHTLNQRVRTYLTRRPHRSFRPTRRRDYARSLKLPGLFAFTKEVNKTLWGYRKIFFWLVVVYGLLTAVIVGIGSQESYTSLTTALRETSEGIFEGNWGELGKASLLFVSIASSGLTFTTSESQQIYAALLILLLWLSTVWLLRNLLAGHKVKVRDGLYNSGSPVVSSFLIAIVLIIQLIPVGLAVLGYTAASTAGLLESGVEAMLFWVAAGLLSALSLYWITSTLFALIVVTLPGTYPFKALRIAGDMVVGRRLRLLIRVLWMLFVTAVAWFVVLVPFILLDTWLKGMWPGIEWVPIIPIILLVVSSVSVVWIATYIYLLYRKVLEDDAKPA